MSHRFKWSTFRVNDENLLLLSVIPHRFRTYLISIASIYIKATVINLDDLDDVDDFKMVTFSTLTSVFVTDRFL